MAKTTTNGRLCPKCGMPLRSYAPVCEDCWLARNSGLWILGKQLARGILGRPRGYGQGDAVRLRG
jgi:hypothetical protein